MKFMVIVKANAASEAGVMPSEKLIAAMQDFNEEMVKAGILLAAEGLHPTSMGARIRIQGERRTVVDGPFAESKELVAGFWLIQVGSREEAIEWMKKCPSPHEEGDGEIEIRQLFTAEDFGPEFTPELRAQQERMEAQVAAR